MKPLNILTATEQVALHLESEILNGHLTGELLGVKTFSKELGINHKTAEGAVKILEKKGLVRANGTGKKRTITPQNAIKGKTLKVNIILYDSDDAKFHYMIDIRDKLLQAGHHAKFIPKSLLELNMNLTRIQKITQKYPADAWIVQSAGREILEWFSQQAFPSFALFGRFRNMPIASTGIHKEEAIVDAVNELYRLGHKRIVMLVHEEQCMPHPGHIPRAFLNALENLGIQSGRYNLPYWHNDRESFHQCLESLFQHTPPTALFITAPSLFIAAQQNLAHKGIVAPDQISMICHDPSPAFLYSKPTISHISHDLNPCINRVLNWVKHVALGKPDKLQTLSKSVFIRGGTIGPAVKK